MLVIKVVPENFNKILARCADLNQKFLEEHLESQRLLKDPTPYYATPWWFDGLGRAQSYSVLFREERLDEEMNIPQGKSDTDWFLITRKKS